MNHFEQFGGASGSVRLEAHSSLFSHSTTFTHVPILHRRYVDANSNVLRHDALESVMTYVAKPKVPEVRLGDPLTSRRLGCIGLFRRNWIHLQLEQSFTFTDTNFPLGSFRFSIAPIICERHWADILGEAAD